MKIRFVSIGKIKPESLFHEPIEHYLKLISKFAVIEREGLKLSSSLGERDAQDDAICLWIEKFAKVGEAKRSHFTLLDERGKLYSSLEFSKTVQDKLNRGLQTWVIFCAGGYGFGKKVIDKIDEVQGKPPELWSLSPMIFAHDLAQLVAIEQLYRGFAILNRHPYHHG